MINKKSQNDFNHLSLLVTPLRFLITQTIQLSTFPAHCPGNAQSWHNNKLGCAA